MTDALRRRLFPDAVTYVAVVEPTYADDRAARFHTANITR